jgi:Protein of unknown function (DUF1153)
MRQFTYPDEPGPTSVKSIDRERLLAKLPAPNTARWVMRRKAAVVAGVRSGLLSVKEACERYRISEEEFHSWATLLDRHGIRGLRSTRLREYRRTSGKTGADHIGHPQPASTN